MGALAPMNIFLRQEIDRMQRVISIVRTTLQDLKLAIDGTIIMSEVSINYKLNVLEIPHLLIKNLRAALDSIYDAKVPPLWQKVSYLLISSLGIKLTAMFIGVLGLLNYWVLVY